MVSSVPPSDAVGLQRREKRREGLSRVPFIGDILAMSRLIRARDAPIWAKLLGIAAAAYVVWPLDLIPDLTPFIFWLDDVGIVLFARILLHRQLAKYRYPLFEDAKRQPPDPTA